MVAWWWAAPRDLRFDGVFPYAYLGDLPPPPPPTLSSANRMRSSALLGAGVAAAGLLFTRDFIDAFAAGWFIGCWAYEAAEPPSARIRNAAWIAGAVGALWAGAAGALLVSSSRAGAVPGAMLLAMLFVRALVLIAAGWYAGYRRTPDTLTQ